jgi:hypothetical protein
MGLGGGTPFDERHRMKKQKHVLMSKWRIGNASNATTKCLSSIAYSIVTEARWDNL